MTVAELLKVLDIRKKYGNENIDIKGIAYDSRLVKKDFIFVAVRGFSVDGHDYIHDAINRGAAAIIKEQAAKCLDSAHIADQDRIACIDVPDTREALAAISTAFYSQPSTRLSLVGITGTNGKTTTSYLVKNIIERAGMKTGLLGTISYLTGSKEVKAANTTPESLDLQRYLNEMVDNGMNCAVMEVSSHALALKRIGGCSFRVAAFTNFTQDHLDFHGTMDEYFDIKSSIFDFLDSSGTAVINIDDPRIRQLAGKIHGNVVTCGFDGNAYITAENVSEHRQGVPSGTSLDVRTPAGKFSVRSPLIGRFNVQNILMSAGIAHALGIDEDAIKLGIENSDPVKGRFERIDQGQNYLCIIDYAHTDDALRKILEEVRKLTRGSIITVFGCGGDRDRAKRPLMGKAASELSDFVIVTSDNPRSEDPDRIISDIVKGIRDEKHMVISDRGEAIRRSVVMAGKGDAIVVAGKGHEDYQEIKGKRHPFSDREILIKAINNNQQH